MPTFDIASEVNQMEVRNAVEQCNKEVSNRQGDVIPGLYAAGETMGLYYRSYTGATSVLKGAVFGRLAGIDAARTKHA